MVTAIRGLIDRKSSSVLVGVCGRSRAGKTTAAHAIVRSLTEAGVAGLHVRLDDWIVPAAERPPNCSAEDRNRIDAMPSLFRGLRAGESRRARL